MKYVWCRSQAEKSTLLYLLGSDAKRSWADKVFEGKKGDLFFARWTFIERADLSATNMVFFFNPSTQTPGPFELRVRVTVPGRTDPLVYEHPSFTANSKLQLLFKQNWQRYIVDVTLDGTLAYRNEFIERDPLL